MKKLLPFILILGFIIPIQPANAVFGLSKCEKLINSLNREQQVGLAQWETANIFRKDALKPSKVGSIGNAEYFIEMVLLVFQSDLNIYKKIEKNGNCFKPDEVAKNRSRLADTQKSIKDLNEWFPYLKSLYEVVNPTTYKRIMGWYTSFYDWKTYKKLNK